MLCPHCATAYHPTVAHLATWVEEGGAYVRVVEASNCPECDRHTIRLGTDDFIPGRPASLGPQAAWRTIYPGGSVRPPCHASVPRGIAQDYGEACAVLDLSPKASAAISRRCLQHILRDAGHVKHSNLASEIDEILAAHSLPSIVADSLDAVREIGNFAAHPTKSTTTGEVVDVEPGEAEWNLDVVEALMDIFYAQPAIIAAKRAALNSKLADAGKHAL